MKAPGDARVVYADIIDHPRHRPQTRPPMPMAERAAQFASFDALAGFSDMIDAEAARTEDADGSDKENTGEDGF